MLGVFLVRLLLITKISSCLPLSLVRCFAISFHDFPASPYFCVGVAVNVSALGPSLCIGPLSILHLFHVGSRFSVHESLSSPLVSV